MFTTTTKMKKYKMKLKKWSRESFGSIKNQIKEARERLWVAEETSARSGVPQEVEIIRKELSQLLEKEEKMWQQRSRVQWLENGYKNTKFFHRIATQRKRRNFIKGLKDEKGVWQNDEHIFSGLLVGFNEKLFASSNPQNMNGVQEVVTDSMRTKLAQAYSVGEVEKAIKDMTPLEAPGPDGMPPPFLSHILVGYRYGHYPGCSFMSEFWFFVKIYKPYLHYPYTESKKPRKSV